MGVLNASARGQSGEIYIVEQGTAAVSGGRGPTVVDITGRLGEQIKFDIYVRHLGPDPLTPLRGAAVELPCMAEGGLSGSVAYVQDSILINSFRNDYLFSFVFGQPAADQSECPDGNFRFAAGMAAGEDRDISYRDPKYLGEFELAVSADASGTFLVPLVGGSGLTDVDSQGIPVFLRTLILTDEPCDIPNVDCTDQNPCRTGECVLYVEQGAGGAHCSSWTNACDNMQDALDEAQLAKASVEIWVAAGTYTPSRRSDPLDPRSATFRLQNGIAVYGGFAGGESHREQRDPTANVTILSGDLAGDDGPGFANNTENCYHVVSTSWTDRSAILDGVTITGGNANGTTPHNVGGGITIVSGSPRISQCVLTGNIAASAGGGMASSDLGSNPLLYGCTFSGNSAAAGGGLYSGGRNLVLTGCLLSGNTASGSGGGMACNGGTVTNCVFAGNSATWGGGSSSVWSATLTVVNCTYSGNTAKASGGAAYHNHASVTFKQCSISGNSAGRTGGLYNTYSWSLIENCILWDNTDNGGVDPWQGCPGGGEGTGLDPLFVDPDGEDDILGTADDDLRLRGASPCIDVGDNESVPRDSVDLDGDGDIWEPLPFDLVGHPRIIDGSGDGEPIVDMGAYETVDCGVGDGDCNDNGVRDVCDISPGGSDDCNGNRVPDECDVSAGTSLDVNWDGVPDECRSFRLFFVPAGDDPARYPGGPTVLNAAGMQGRTLAVEMFIDRAPAPIRGVAVNLPCSASGGVGGAVEYVPDSGFIDFARQDYIFADISSATAWDQRCDERGLRIAAAVASGSTVEGAKYIAGLELTISSDAQGTFTIVFDDTSSVADSDSQTIAGLTLEPLIISVGCPAGACADVGDCTCNAMDGCTLASCINGSCVYGPRIAGDVTYDGVVDMFDILCVLDGIGGTFDNCASAAVDIAGCQADGTIDLFDLIAVLDAFQGVDSCLPSCGRPLLP